MHTLLPVSICQLMHIIASYFSTVSTIYKRRLFWISPAFYFKSFCKLLLTLIDFDVDDFWIITITLCMTGLSDYKQMARMQLACMFDLQNICI